jgi:hypothetical protein
VLSIGLQVRKQPSVAQIDAVAAHRHALRHQPRALTLALSEAAVSADDAVPREVVVDGREDKTDKARRARIDVAVGADKPGRDGPYPADDLGGSLLRGYSDSSH